MTDEYRLFSKISQITWSYFGGGVVVIPHGVVDDGMGAADAAAGIVSPRMAATSRPEYLISSIVETSHTAGEPAARQERCSIQRNAGLQALSRAGVWCLARSE
jgi:hypothetical protein